MKDRLCDPPTADRDYSFKVIRKMGLKPRPFRTAFLDSGYSASKLLGVLRQQKKQNN
jgi:hypothetical protein